MFYNNKLKNKISNSTLKSKKKQDEQERFFYCRTQTLKLAKILSTISPRLKVVRNLKECSNVAYFENDYCSNSHKLLSKKLISHSCKHKFCYYCNRQKSKKLKKFFYQNITKEELAKKNLVFLTITIPQHKVYELKQSLKMMNKGWSKLKKYKDIKKIFLGFLKKTEASKGTTTDKLQAHLHQHIIIEVPKNYYKSRDYLTQKKLLFLIRKAYKLPIKVIDIRKVYNKNGEIDEILKYSLKLQSFTRKEGETDRELASYLLRLESELKGSRQLSCGGTFKGAIKKPEDIDDDILDEEIDEENTYKKYQPVITISLGKFFIGKEVDEPPPKIVEYLKSREFRKKTIKIE